ncbi:hypothetical protein [Paraburkholderia nemoris]|uniref:hypothetical protein n=1 Tax=Paraburkholderia nemoris TaxID=2793076 RepID=UPI001B1CDAA9|nr:hypothetical protein [Paraburkholderia nemoris]CAE6828614.1 hypothetical protein LMG22931_06692 [Paraburkholderia nemoris]
MKNPLPEVDPSTWRFMRNIYRRIYHEKSLTDWLSSVRLAHAVLHDEDIRVDRLLAQCIAILEYTIIARAGHVPFEISGSSDDNNPSERNERRQVRESDTND